jgi:single-strand DNA-binding protein
VNKVILVGHVVTDPELRVLSDGTTVTTFIVSTNDFVGGVSTTSFHDVVVRDSLAAAAARYLRRRNRVAIEGRLATRHWQDERGVRRSKVEVVATELDLISIDEEDDPRADLASWPRPLQGVTP